MRGKKEAIQRLKHPRPLSLYSLFAVLLIASVQSNSTVKTSSSCLPTVMPSAWCMAVALVGKRKNPLPTESASFNIQ